MTILCPEQVEKVQPPAFVARQATEDLSKLESDGGKKLKKASEVFLGTNRIPLGWKEELPTDLDQLKTTPRVFVTLKQLKKNWDGYDAEPLSDLLLENAQDFWFALPEVATEMPAVYPGADNFLVFSWINFRKEKQLDISIYEEDGNITCNWLAKSRATRKGDSAPFDISILKSVLRMYNSL